MSLKEFFQSIADAIRRKKGTTAPIPVRNIPSEIDSIISTNTVELQSKTVTPTQSSQTVEPDSNYYGLSKVTVNGSVNLKSENIKKDVNIFGYIGTYSGTELVSSTVNIGVGDTYKINIDSSKNYLIIPQRMYDDQGNTPDVIVSLKIGNQQLTYNESYHSKWNIFPVIFIRQGKAIYNSDYDNMIRNSLSNVTTIEITGDDLPRSEYIVYEIVTF